MVESFINFYHINLYGYYWNGYKPVYESNTIKNIKREKIGSVLSCNFLKFF